MESDHYNCCYAVDGISMLFIHWVSSPLSPPILLDNEKLYTPLYPPVLISNFEKLFIDPRHKIMTIFQQRMLILLVILALLKMKTMRILQ